MLWKDKSHIAIDYIASIFKKHMRLRTQKFNDIKIVNSTNHTQSSTHIYDHYCSSGRKVAHQIFQSSRSYSTMLVPLFVLAYINVALWSAPVKSEFIKHYPHLLLHGLFYCNCSSIFVLLLCFTLIMKYM